MNLLTDRKQMEDKACTMEMVSDILETPTRMCIQNKITEHVDFNQKHLSFEILAM